MRKLIALFLILNYSCSKQSTALIKTDTADNHSSFLQAEEVRMAQPRVIVDSLLFRKSAKVNISFALEDAKVYYTLSDGEEKIYSSPLEINESAELKIKTVKEGYKSSRWKKVQLVKVTNKLNDVKIEVYPSPSENYPGNGATSLVDLQKGSYNFREGNHWLGFQSEKVDVNLDFEEATEISKIHVSYLRDHAAWIFGPATFKVFVDNKLELTTTRNAPLAENPASLNLYPLGLINPVIGTNIRLEIENLNQIPAWHGES